MSLNLNIEKLPGPGRRKVPVHFEIVREMGEADLGALATQDVGSTPAPIKRITDRHHSLARLLAAGTTEAEAAMITGYDSSRISILKNSPAFQELLALYRGEVDREFATVLDHMSGLSKDALLELRERMEETPDKFTNGELLRVITDLVDRTVSDGPDHEKLPHVIELVAGDSPPKIPAADKVEADDDGADTSST